MKKYDLLIIGAGPAGVMAARGAAADGLSVLILEKGAKLTGRRDLATGWFGHGLHAFDRMEGDESLENVGEVLSLCRSANNGWLEHKGGKGALPECGMRLLPCNYYCIPSAVAAVLAETFYRELEPATDIVFHADVGEVSQCDNGFVAVTDRGSFAARKCLLATGSRSAEWVMDVCSSLGIARAKPKVRLGVRVEAPTKMVRYLAIEQGDILAEYEAVLFDDARFGGFVGEWEDFGMVSAFGHTLPDKRSRHVNFMASFVAENGLAEAVRTVRIVNVLSNDKVRRERICDFLQGKSVLRHFPQFEHLKAAFTEFDRLVPKFTTTAAIYAPEIRIDGALPAEKNMRTVLPGLYGAGQCVTGIRTLLEAMASGVTAAKSITENRSND